MARRKQAKKMENYIIHLGMEKREARGSYGLLTLAHNSHILKVVAVVVTKLRPLTFRYVAFVPGALERV